jgi:hypothetical protein
MTQNTHDDEFSYDDTPSGGAQTFTDEQPSGGAPGGGDKYAALSGIPAGTGEPTGPAKCMGPFTEARIITKEGTTYVAIKLVVATCSGRALVVRSQSLGVLSIKISRTHPPTRYASNPASWRRVVTRVTNGGTLVLSIHRNTSIIYQLYIGKL